MSINTLREMLTYCRSAGSATERAFINRYIATLPGAYQDVYSNWHVTIGEAPILWSCHTDTVHHRQGRQQVITQNGRLALSAASGKASNCLGGDDTVGVYICREMVLAKVPGHYIFHYGEEKGCIGSALLAEECPEWVQTFNAAIAFDRAGTSDVITHQCGRRTCSETFAQAIADSLNVSGMTYSPCDRGVYTDTEQYAALIPECTNISVGYAGAHTANETIDIAHVARLRNALVKLGETASSWPIERDPSLVEDAYAWVDDYIPWKSTLRIHDCNHCGRMGDGPDQLLGFWYCDGCGHINLDDDECRA